MRLERVFLGAIIHKGYDMMRATSSESREDTRCYSRVMVVHGKEVWWGDITKGTCGSTILGPHGKLNSFAPEGFGKATLVEDGLDVLEEPAVEGLCYAIVLGGVVHCEASLGALLLEEVGELLASVLATVVRAEPRDAHTMLGLGPGGE